jgi:chromosome segregation ATPase
LRAELPKTEQSLKEEIKSLTSQLAEARENQQTFQTTETQLKVSTMEALKENSQLQASQKQLLQETKALKTQVHELKKQKTTLEHHIVCAEEVMYDKDHMWSLTSCFAKIRVLGEDLTINGDLKLEMTRLEYVGHLEFQPKSASEKLVYGAMLKVCLQTLQGERNQICTQLFEVN